MKIFLLALSLSALAASPTEELEKRVMQAMNRARVEGGLKAFAWNDSLAKAARHHAKNMAVLGVYAPKIEKADLPTTESRVDHYGYIYSNAAEAIGRGEKDPEGVVRSWLSSAARPHVMDAALIHAGVGVFIKDGTTYYDAVMGRPAQ